jgi:hypothetical protein
MLLIMMKRAACKRDALLYSAAVVSEFLEHPAEHRELVGSQPLRLVAVEQPEDVRRQDARLLRQPAPNAPPSTRRLAERGTVAGLGI